MKGHTLPSITLDEYKNGYYLSRDQLLFGPLAIEKMADITLSFTAARNCFLAFKTLFAHYSLPNWCIYGNKDGRK